MCASVEEGVEQRKEKSQLVEEDWQEMEDVIGQNMMQEVQMTDWCWNDPLLNIEQRHVQKEAEWEDIMLKEVDNVRGCYEHRGNRS